MCSQPPRDNNDDWRVDELLDLVPLIDCSVPALAITGGEPTLLGHRLAQVIEGVTICLPNTQLNILTNARRLAAPSLAEEVTKCAGRVLWAVPLYADIAARHDYVVQSDGAFEETVNGIYNLAERHAAIEIRIVLHQQTIERLLPFAEFIWRTMPFVRHVAFMGLEPMGFAKTNRDLLYLDPLDYRDQLETAVWHLHDRGIVTSIYNTPLCLLFQDIWPLARKSISDWKNAFVPECEGCTVRDACGGFFVSAGSGWRSRGIKPFKEEMCPCPRIGGNMCATCLVGQAQDRSHLQARQRQALPQCLMA
jgi:His-Xaa-Ser system radical SAM maturase HxsC